MWESLALTGPRFLKPSNLAGSAAETTRPETNSCGGIIRHKAKKFLVARSLTEPRGGRQIDGFRLVRYLIILPLALTRTELESESYLVRGHIDKPISYIGLYMLLCSNFYVLFALLIVKLFWKFSFWGAHLFLDDEDAVRHRLSAVEMADFSAISSRRD